MTDTVTMPDVVPLFPLNVVLLPGMPLPLHIFERRYRELLTDVTAPGARRAFGVVAGHIGGVPVADVGTMAEIMENESYADGRSDLLTVGSRRFRVLSLDPDTRPYLQAEVEWLEEDDGELDMTVLEMARRLSAAYGEVLQRITGREVDEPLPTGPLRTSYEIATRLHLTAADRQELLAAPTAADRLAREIELLRREIPLVSSTHAVPVPLALVQIVPGVS